MTTHTPPAFLPLATISRPYFHVPHLGLISVPAFFDLFVLQLQSSRFFPYGTLFLYNFTNLACTALHSGCTMYSLVSLFSLAWTVSLSLVFFLSISYPNESSVSRFEFQLVRNPTECIMYIIHAWMRESNGYTWHFSCSFLELNLAKTCSLSTISSRTWWRSLSTSHRLDSDWQDGTRG